LTQPEVTATPTAAQPSPYSDNRPVAPATVQQLSIADIRARVVAILKESDDEVDGLTDDDLARLTRLEHVQIGENNWKVGSEVPGAANYSIFALFNGADNEHVADPHQGDIRVWAVPLTVSQPGARDYRCYTVNPMIGKTLSHSLTFEGFCQEVAFEELTVAERLGLLDDEDDDTPDLETKS